MKYYKVPENLLVGIIKYLENTSLPYKDVKAIITDIQKLSTEIIESVAKQEVIKED